MEDAPIVQGAVSPTAEAEPPSREPRTAEPRAAEPL